MKLKVDKDLCIGCGACQAVCPEVFEIEDDGLATTIVDEVPKEIKENIEYIPVKDYIDVFKIISK